MVRPSRRGGVPVLRRPCGSFSSLSRADRVSAGASPARPPAWLSSPTWIRPSRNVPAVRTTLCAEKRMPTCVTTPVTRSPVDHQVVARALEQREIRLVLEAAPNRRLVEQAIGLRPGRPHRRALGAVQDPELDAGLVGRRRHRAAQGIDLLDQMPLADAADRRVAAHLPERLDRMRQQQRRRAHARGSERRLGAGMAAADDDDVEVFGIGHAVPAQGRRLYFFGLRRVRGPLPAAA